MFEGRKALPVLKDILERHGVQADQEALDEALRQKRHYFQTHMKFGLNPQALWAVCTLQDMGLQIAAVSGSTRENLKRVILQDEQQLFQLILGAEDYQNGKPSPEPYLTACERLGLVPADSVVVENAPLGIESAKSAGIITVALLSTLSHEDLAGADYYISSLTEIPALIATM